MALDIRTFWLIIAVVATGVGVLVLVVRNAFPARFHRMLTYYSVANLSLALSYLSLAIPDWTGGFLFHVVSWVLTAAYLSLEYLAFCLLKEQKLHRALVYGPPALAAAICIWCSYVHHNISVQMTLLDTLIMAMLWMIAWTLAQRVEGTKPLADLLAAAVYGALALVSLAEVVYTLWVGSFPREFNYNQPRAIYFMVGATCTEVIVFPLFLLMLSERINRILTEQAMHDPLTGLYNRRAFEEIAYREIAGAARTKATFSILLCDLDRFKEVNDRYGHATGDAILRAAAARLRRGLREEDFLCRWGGDEFCALLPRARCKEALLVAERVRQRFEESAGYYGAPALRITSSIGIVSSEASDADLASLVRMADRALYQAKESGRNRVAVAAETGQQTNETAKDWETGLA
ncbi:MAG: GGDEF domain-containing protein [Terracidiphilus sp.]